MSDSLLDEAIRYCDEALLDMRDTPERSCLRTRLHILIRATWSVSLLRPQEQQLLGLAKLALALRDDVASAVAAEGPSPSATV